MLKKFIFSLTAIIALSLAVIAQDKQPTELTGFITDKGCAAKVGNASDPQVAAADHEKKCVLGCSNSGLGIYSDGKFTQFDEKGSQVAKAALEKSKKDKGAKFKVTGKVADGKMTVESIAEVE
ncbi:MAG: hypothetical protein ACREA2_02925 [Blastocatellia bacterium]